MRRVDDKFMSKVQVVALMLLLVVSTYSAIMLRSIPPQAKIYSDLASTAAKVESSHQQMLVLGMEVNDIRSALEEIRALTIIRYQRIANIDRKIQTMDPNERMWLQP